MLTTRQKRTGSLSFEQLKAEAQAKNLDLVRHPKSGFRILFKGSDSTIHAADRIYGLRTVRLMISGHTPADED